MTNPEAAQLDDSREATRHGEDEQLEDWALREVLADDLDSPITTVYISYPEHEKIHPRNMSVNFHEETGTLVFDAAGHDYDEQGIWESFFAALAETDEEHTEDADCWCNPTVETVEGDDG